MTTDEKLDLILSDMQGMKTDMQGMKTGMQDMKTEVQGMKTDMQDMKTEVQGMKTDMQGMKTDMQDMKTEVQGIKTDMQDMKTDMQELKRRMISTELHIENVTDKNIQLIAENFITLTKKLNEAIPVAEKNLAYEVKVNYLVEKVQILEKEVAELKSKIA